MKGIDLTEGNIFKVLIRVALPVVFTMLISMAYNLTDIYWLGKVGKEAVTAAGTMGMFMWLGFSIAAIFRTGTEIEVAQFYGKKDYKKVNQYATNSLLFAFVVALIYGVVIYFSTDTIVDYYNFESQKIVKYIYDYAVFVPLIIIGNMIANSFTGSYRGIGATKIILYFQGVSLLINMILDPLFIIGFKMEVYGASLATCIAICVLLLLYVWYSRYKSDITKNFVKNIDLSKIGKLARLGIAPTIQQVTFTAVYIIINVYIVRFGDDSVVVGRIGGQIESLVWAIGIAVTTAVTVFTGQNYAVEKFDRVGNCVTFSFIITMIYGIAVAILFLLFGEELFSIFVKNDLTVLKMGATYLMFTALAQPFMMSESVLTGYFNGQGKTTIPSVITLIANAIRVPLAIYLGMQYGLNGVWMGFLITAVFRGVTLLIATVLSVRRNDNISWKSFILKKEVYNA